MWQNTPSRRRSPFAALFELWEIVASSKHKCRRSGFRLRSKSVKSLAASIAAKQAEIDEVAARLEVARNQFRFIRPKSAHQLNYCDLSVGGEG